MCDKWWSNTLGCLLGLAVLVGGPPAVVGQNQGPDQPDGADEAAGDEQEDAGLPTSLIAASSLGPDQKQQVRRYVTAAVSKLERGSPEAVTAARETLIEPYGTTSSDAFEAFYAQVVLDQVMPLFQQAGALVRLNAAIVVARMQQPEALEFASRALGGDDAAVRYWGAEALRRYVERAQQTEGAIEAQTAETIRTIVSEQVTADTPASVAEPAMLALVRLNSDEARDQLRQLLTDRLSRHVNDPAASYNAENAAMRRLLSQLQDQADQNAVTNAQVRTMATVAFRYLRLVARQLNEADLSEAQAASHRRLVGLTSDVLRWSAGYLGASTYPDAVTAEAEPGTVATRADEWQSRLTESPYSIDSEALALPQ